MKHAFLITVAGFCLSSTPLTAQVVLELHDGSVEFSSRGSISTGTTGWVVNRYARDAQGGGIGAIVGLSAIVQDTDCSTQAQGEFALFGESTALSGTPDESVVLASTGPFLFPAGSAAPCALNYTITFPMPLVHCPAAQDVFVGVFLDSSASWPDDAPSSQISVESPNAVAAAQYPPATAGQGPGSTYGASFLTGSGGAANTAYAIPWPIYMAFLRIDGPSHVTRAGVTNAQGFADFGMSGRFPDAVNRAGSMPPREDDPIWLGEAPSFTSGFAFLCLSPFHSRAVPLPGIGCLEILPPNVQLPTVPVTGAQVTHAFSLGAARALMVGGLDVWVQEIRHDPVTGRTSIGSLARSTYY